MKRRSFIVLLGGAAALPFAARAQRPMPVIGLLRSNPTAASTHLIAAFRQGLNEAGFVEGQNVVIEHHSSEGQPDRLPALVAELICRPVDLIAGNTVAMLAAKQATTTIPIVFAGGSDPVKQGLVTSLNRPGGNVTGAMFFAGELGTKRLELLRLLAPKATSIGMLVNPNTDETEAERRDVLAAGRAMRQQLIILDVASLRDIEAALQRSASERRRRASRCRPVLGFASGTVGCSDGAPCAAGDPSPARVCDGWRPDELWNQHN